MPRSNRPPPFPFPKQNRKIDKPNLGKSNQTANTTSMIARQQTAEAKANTNSENIFEAIEKQDVLLYHPFDSFEPVVKFIKQAAADPETITIRMTLYRAGPNSPIVKALIDAVRDGKQVMPSATDVTLTKQP